MTTTIAVASATGTCDTLFANNPDAVYAEVHEGGTEEWINVMVPGTGEPACYMIVRDSAAPGRYSVSMWPAGYLGDIGPGSELPGEIADILTDGIPVRKGAHS